MTIDQDIVTHVCFGPVRNIKIIYLPLNECLFWGILLRSKQVRSSRF